MGDVITDCGRNNAVVVDDSGVTVDQVWEDAAVYFLEDGIDVATNVTLEIKPGTLIKTDASGGHKFKLTIPNNSKLKGVKFFNQYVVDDPKANGFGATFSNGGAATIG